MTVLNCLKQLSCSFGGGDPAGFGVGAAKAAKADNAPMIDIIIEPPYCAVLEIAVGSEELNEVVVLLDDLLHP